MHWNYWVTWLDTQNQEKKQKKPSFFTLWKTSFIKGRHFRIYTIHKTGFDYRNCQNLRFSFPFPHCRLAVNFGFHGQEIIKIVILKASNLSSKRAHTVISQP